MAAASITFDTLKAAYDQGGENSLKMLFAEDVSGRPRITKNKKIISSVAKYFQENR